MSWDPIIWASLFWKPCTESSASGSTGDMSQMNTHEITWIRKQVCWPDWPPTSTYWWMTKWNDERCVFTTLYISRWSLGEVLRPLSICLSLTLFTRNWCFCWNFMTVLFCCQLYKLLKVHVVHYTKLKRSRKYFQNLQKRCLNLLGSRGAACAVNC